MTRRQRFVAAHRNAHHRFRALDRSDRIRLLAFVGIGLFLMVFRIGAIDRMHASDAMVPGTPSDEARTLTERAFGSGQQNLMIVLRGPAGQLDRQGPGIAKRVSQLPGFRVLDPWGPGGPALRPKPGIAELVVSIDKQFDQVARFESTRVSDLLERTVKPPVRAHLTGFAPVNRAITDESVHALRVGELVTMPILVILLLLIFGNPIAAGMPLVLGGLVASASAGTLDLINRFVTPLEVTSITLGMVTALALGVDYSLLIVARFRHELAEGATVRDAVDIATKQAGRTVKFAAGVMGCAMLTALIVSPASVLKSATAGVLVALVGSVIGAVVALPPLMRWAGRDINSFQIVTPLAERSWGRLANVALRRPVLASLLVIATFLILALPAPSLQTGPPDPRILPKDSVVRTDYETVMRELGGGQAFPFTVTVVARKGTLADGRLDELTRFERELRSDPSTAQVLGPTAIAQRTAELAKVPGGLRRSKANAVRGERGAAQLEDGLAQASRGAERLVSGLSAAAKGSAQLHDGHVKAERGVAQLAPGAATASSGATKLRGGVASVRKGVRDLTRGSAQARDGANQIVEGIATAQKGLQNGVAGAMGLASDIDGATHDIDALRERAQQASDAAAAAQRALDQMLPESKEDPSYGSARAELASAAQTLGGTGDGGLAAVLGQGATEASQGADAARKMQDGVKTLGGQLAGLATTSTSLHDGLERLLAGNRDLEHRTDRLLAEARQIESGLGQASDRAGTLLDSVRGLGAGSARLKSTLDAAAIGSTPLAVGLTGAHDDAVGLVQTSKQLGKTLGEAETQAPLFESGYAKIAGIETAPPQLRAAAAWAINYDRGGTAVRFLVSSRDGLPTRADNAFRKRLAERVEAFGKRTGTIALVGGPPAQLGDFDRASKDALPKLVFLLLIVAYVALVPLMRSLILPLIAVALNVLTLLAGLGVLALTFGPDPLLGGAGFLDDIVMMVVFTMTFALSLDYSIFILDRMREGFDRTKSVDGAIAYGIEGTAGVLTGAAAIMTGVFITFAVVSPIVSLRQVGIGMGVAVVLDATLLRLVLLPAVVRLAGERAWHVPPWVDRLSQVLTRTRPGAAQATATGPASMEIADDRQDDRVHHP